MNNNQLKVDGRKNYVISVYAGRICDICDISTRAKIEICGKASIYWFNRIAELDANHLANLINAFKEETSCYITPDGIEVMESKLANGKWVVTRCISPLQLLPTLKFIKEVKEARGRIYATIVWRSGNVTHIRLKEIKK